MRNSLIAIGIVLTIIGIVALHFFAYHLAEWVCENKENTIPMIKDVVTALVGIILGRYIIVQTGGLD